MQRKGMTGVREGVREGSSYSLHSEISPKWAIIHVQAVPGNFLWVVEWWVNEGIALH